MVGFGNLWLGLVVERLTMGLSGGADGLLLSGRGGWGRFGSGWVWKPLVGFGLSFVWRSAGRAVRRRLGEVAWQCEWGTFRTPVLVVVRLYQGGGDLARVLGCGAADPPVR